MLSSVENVRHFRPKNKRKLVYNFYIFHFQAPRPESDVKADYEMYIQKGIVPDFDPTKGYFYSRGHLTPNGAFATDAERRITWINTNIAPQWQTFNGENWGALEGAVRTYSNNHRRKVYVFTGTGKIYGAR